MEREPWGRDLPEFSWPGERRDHAVAAVAEAARAPLDPAIFPDGYRRILPPDSMRDYGSRFERDREMEAFLRCEFTGRGGIFWDPEHAHLADASIGFRWSNVRHVQKGKEKAGMMELLPDPMTEPKSWTEASRRDYLAMLYEGDWPLFQMTLSSVWSWRYDDRSFFALVDHEVCHAAVARDKHAAPRFHPQTNEPIYCIRPHDHELFTGTVRRFGVHATGTAELVEAGNRRPFFEWVPGTSFTPPACATCRGTRR